MTPGDYHTLGCQYILNNFFDSIIEYSGNVNKQIDFIRTKLNAYWAIDISQNSMLEILFDDSTHSFLFVDEFVSDFQEFRAHILTLPAPFTNDELDIMEDWHEGAFSTDFFDSGERADYISYLSNQEDIIRNSSLPNKNLLLDALTMLESSVNLWPLHYESEFGPALNKRFCIIRALYADVDAFATGVCSDSPDTTLTILCAIAVSLLKYEDCVD